MRIYLCGQKHFGLEALRLLLSLGHDVAGVSAPRQSKGGRPDRLFNAAREAALPVIESGNLNAETLPGDVDLILCAHSHDFIGRATRLRAKYGAIGYHPSLLPLHRGRDAIKWAIRMGERVTGGSVYWLNDITDGGPIAAQDWCFIRPGDDAESLWRRELQPMGLRLIEKTLCDVARGVVVRIPQEPSLATWEPSLEPPRLRRPDLPLIGDGAAVDYRVVVDREFEQTMRLYAPVDQTGEGVSTTTAAL